MNLPYPVLAALLGAVGFATIEIASRMRGLFTALTATPWGDALVYVVATGTLALVFLPAFRRSRGLASLGAVLLYVLSYAPWTAAIAGVVDLTLRSAWGDPLWVRGAFIEQPINLAFTFTVDLGVVLIPLGLASAFALRLHARR